jgi:hypothetical protein
MSERPIPGSPEDMRRLMDIVDRAQKIEIDLQPAPDDPRVNDPKFQEELSGFSKSLRGTGVTVSSGQWLSIRSMLSGIHSLSLWSRHLGRQSFQLQRVCVVLGKLRT